MSSSGNYLILFRVGLPVEVARGSNLIKAKTLAKHLAGDRKAQSGWVPGFAEALDR
jgi:hypothetical protein